MNIYLVHIVGEECEHYFDEVDGVFSDLDKATEYCKKRMEDVKTEELLLPNIAYNENISYFYIDEWELDNGICVHAVRTWDLRKENVNG